ncbi:MAG: porin family protein [Bacteroidota bacterium]
MKTKSFFILLALCLTTATAHAQFGVRAGYNFTNASVDFDDPSISTGGDKGRFMAGIFYNIPLLGSFITVQPEVNYMGRAYDLDASGEGTNPSSGEIEASFAYIDAGGLVRLNIGHNSPLGFYVGAGPFLSFAVSGQINDEDIDFDTQRLRRNELLLAGVGGVNFGKLFVEIRYYGSLSDQAEPALDEIRQRSLGLNVGLSF